MKDFMRYAGLGTIPVHKNNDGAQCVALSDLANLLGVTAVCELEQWVGQAGGLIPETGCCYRSYVERFLHQKGMRSLFEHSRYLKYKGLLDIPVYLEDGIAFITEEELVKAGMPPSALASFERFQMAATSPVMGGRPDCHFVWDFERFMSREWT